MKEITFSMQRFSATMTGTSWSDSLSNTADDAVIYGYGGNDTIKNTGNRVKIDGGDGADNIESGYYINSTNYGGQFVTIVGGNGNDSVLNHSGGNKTVIDVGAGNDTITDYGASNTILAGAGSDVINLRSNPKTVDGGAGNDTINDYYGGGSINGGAGNDIISISGGTLVSTVLGGADNDKVYLNGSKGVVYQYKIGDGYDTIYNYDSADTISIGGSAYYSTIKSGSDHVVSIIGSGSMTLKNVSTANIVGGIYTVLGGLTVSNSNNNTVITGTSYADSIKNFANNVTVNGGANNDTIYTSGDKNIVNGDAGNDHIYVWSEGTNITVDAGAGNDLVHVYANAKNHFVTAGAGNDTIEMSGNSVKGYGDSGDDYFYVYANGYNHTLIGGEGKDSAYSGGDNVLIDMGNGDDYVRLFTQAIRHTVKGGTGNDTIENYSANGNFYQYNSGEGNDVIVGINANDTLQIAGTKYSTAKSGSNLIVTAGSGKISVQGGANVAFTILGTPEDEVIFNSAKTSATITADYADDTFDAAAYSKLVTLNATKATVDLEILGNAKNNKIFGSENNDTLYGGKGTDTLKGNGGEDTFHIVKGEGNKFIADYTEGEDIIYVEGADVTTVIASASVKSGNVIFKVGTNNVTVKGGDGQEILFVDEDGEEYTYPDSGGDDVIFNAASTSATITAYYEEETFDAADYSKLVTIDATEAEIDLEILGNAKNNKIFGSENNDTLYGGKGTDTLTGNGGDDTFHIVKGEGNKTIADYTEGEDIIYVEGAAVSTVIKSATVSGNNVVFKVGTNKITVKNAKGSEITFMDADGEEYSYGAAASGRSAMWFTEDDTNFISDTPQLDAISAPKYAVTTPQETSLEIFAQNPHELQLVSSDK